MHHLGRTSRLNSTTLTSIKVIIAINKKSFSHYHALIKDGCPRELARSVLPVGTYSHMFATANLHNWFNFLRERLHPHAQYEIRVYAEAIAEELRIIAPIAVEVFFNNLEKKNG